MKRIIVAAAALAAVATPALAGVVRVPVAGKSPEQVYNEVWRASLQACQKAFGQVTIIQAYRACVATTARESLARVNDPQVAELARRVNAD